MTGTRNILALVLWLALCFVPSLFGIFFAPGEWYAALRKPSWNPPGWIFGPVWSLLYATMGVAAWLVWKRGGFRMQARPLGIFLVQLALNAAWSPLFFGLHMPGLAFAEILLLWAAILATIVALYRVSRPGALILLPYLAWVTFAAALNFTIWRLNS